MIHRLPITKTNTDIYMIILLTIAKNNFATY